MNEIQGYGQKHEEAMQLFSRSLGEDHRRHYAGIEALKIGFGGIVYGAGILGMGQ